MVILVTGYKGFIGKNILKEIGYNFITIDDEYFSKPNPQEYLIDFLNNKNPDVIFHIGACSNTLNTDIDYMMSRNYLSTKWFVDWCSINNKKIIYSSSAAIYGTDNQNPSNLYGWTKLLGEDYVISNGGISLRYFNVYGPGEEHKGKMSSMVYQIMNSKEVNLFPKNPTRDFVYISDVVKANFYALQYYEELKGKWYEVGTTQSVSFEKICKELNVPYSYLKADKIPEGYQFKTKSLSKNHMGGWQPNINIYDGIKLYKEYYKDKKVSFVCTTYRRFTCVERIIGQFYAQTYPNKELIIFNTDEEYPLELDFHDDSITVINNGIDYKTNLEYKNRGQICRDAVTHATGEYFMLADDDDIYLPWHIQQAVDGIKDIQRDAWKPRKSLFATRNKISLVQNTLEASVIVKMKRIREIGFRDDITGYEGLSWYSKLRDEKQLNELNENYIPSYCFNWSDLPEVAGHKQSGNIDNPNNFEEHKTKSTDFAKRKLQKINKNTLNEVYKKYYEWIENNLDILNIDYYERYAKKYTNGFGK
jgi:ADP-L-glycero-D-manno-heptose 6-epimerase